MTSDIYLALLSALSVYLLLSGVTAYRKDRKKLKRLMNERWVEPTRRIQ